MLKTTIRKRRETHPTDQPLRWARWVALAATTALAVPALSSCTPDDPPGDLIFDSTAKPVLDWSVPRRFEDSWAAYNETSATYDQGIVKPNSWGLNLDGCASTAVRRIQKYTFTVRQTGKPWQRTFNSTSCRLQIPKILPAQGLYKATLTLHTDWGAADGVSASVSMNVGIRDYLIVSMGDSLASGEGTPDVPGSYSFDPDFAWPPAHVVTKRAAVWKDRRCHRSAKSGPSQAAKAFEDADPKTSVTFVSVACSGATVADLIPRPDEKVLGQVGAVASLFGPNSDGDPRPIDSLLLSAGINDLDFSSIIGRCAFNNNLSRDSEKCVTKGGIAEAINTLPVKYLNLAVAIKRELPDAREVYINDYPGEVFEGGGCGLLGEPGIGIDEVEESEMNVYGNQLNRHIENMATMLDRMGYRWNFVDRLEHDFLPHAYCATPSWFTSLETSLRTQGDAEGTAHPNAAGHIAFSKILHRMVVPEHVKSPYRTLKITIDEVKAADGQGTLQMLASLTKFQNDRRGLNRYIDVPRNGQWTSIPPDEGTFFLDVTRAPSPPRHATDLWMNFGHTLAVHHGLSDAYGAGPHEVPHNPTGLFHKLSVRYTVSVLAPPSGDGDVLARDRESLQARYGFEGSAAEKACHAPRTREAGGCR